MLALHLCSIDSELAGAYRAFCGDLDFVKVHEGDILELAVDAVVSPANSFGFMDGGIDALYTRHFGNGVGQRVRKGIEEEFHGELLVGQALIVETEIREIPFLIAAPTMRVPMILQETVNPYLAARAVFLLVEHGRFASGRYAGEAIKERVKSVAMPGLGTGVGQVGPHLCAHQVRKAIDDILLRGFTPPRTWAEASERHQLLYRQRPGRLQHGT